MGGYIPSVNKSEPFIVLRHGFSAKRMLEPIDHEMFHHYQKLIINGIIPRPRGISREQVNGWRAPYHKSTIISNFRYKTHLIELDARQFAIDSKRKIDITTELEERIDIMVNRDIRNRLINARNTARGKDHISLVEKIELIRTLGPTIYTKARAFNKRKQLRAKAGKIKTAPISNIAIGH